MLGADGHTGRKQGDIVAGPVKVVGSRECQVRQARYGYLLLVQNAYSQHSGMEFSVQSVKHSPFNPILHNRC